MTRKSLKLPKSVEYLCERDPKFSALVEKFGIIRRGKLGEPFATLAGCFVAQQVSSKAADAITARLELLCGGTITPEAVVRADIPALRSCGLSERKAQYLRAAAEKVLSGEFDISELKKLDTDTAVERITSLKGAGIWTAEMMLIFALGNPDVLSFKDLGIRRGLVRLHNLKELTPAKFEKFRKLYSPQGTIASLYLWRLAGEK